MGMEFGGEQFVDYGNALECTEPFIQSYEVLTCGVVRLFVCKKVNNQPILDHTDIASTQTLLALSRRLREIALAVEAARAAPSVVPAPMITASSH